MNALTSLRLTSVVASADDKQMDADSDRLEEEAELVYNDYNQYYVDSGLTVLPGTWVQNVSPETRFVEYVSYASHTDIPSYAVSFMRKQRLSSIRLSLRRTTKPI